MMIKKWSACGVAWLAMTGVTQAAEEVAGVVISPTALYVTAVVVGIIGAFVLSRMARANAKVDISVGRTNIRDLNLDKVIDDRLGAVVGSRESRQQIVRSISGVVEERVSRRIDEVSSQLKAQYESTIAQKEKDQEIIQVKYKNMIQEKNQTEAIVQSLAEGLVVVNGKGEVVMMNPAAEKLLGMEKKQKMGRPLTENLSGDALVSLVQDAKAGGEKVVELNSTQQETKKIIRASSALVENENGQTVGMVSVLTDVTKQRELDRLKSQFVSNVTHELRTPLVATQKALDVIVTRAAGPVNDDQARFLDIARRNLDRLYRLINDILDFSKLEAGKMRIEFAPASMAQVVGDVCAALESWATSKGIKLERQVEEGLPEVFMDAQRIIQVLTNLAGNALKFTPKDGRVTIAALSRNGGQEVEVRVSDTGVGIAREDLARIFERFLQVGERRQADVTGTGLGLSIAKEIIQLHGGRIWAESEKGHGATFIFTLPVQRRP